MTRAWMRNSLLLLALAGMLSGTAGCGWMGKTAGKAQAAVENGVEAMNKGYKDGYEEKRAKENTGSQEKTADGKNSASGGTSKDTI